MYNDKHVKKTHLVGEYQRKYSNHINIIIAFIRVHEWYKMNGYEWLNWDLYMVIAYTNKKKIKELNQNRTAQCIYKRTLTHISIF